VSIRLEYWRAAPDEFKALLSAQLRLKAGFDPILFELVSLRVSQINGCPFCVDLHAGELRKAGEIDRRVEGLAVWRNATFFSAAEQAALGWAERLTTLRDAEPLGAAYDALRPHFSDRQIAVLTFAVAQMNAMNRIAIAFGRKAASDAASSSAAVASTARLQGR
jgi:AhpD family alkylhydroperoxidase